MGCRAVLGEGGIFSDISKEFNTFIATDQAGYDTTLQPKRPECQGKKALHVSGFEALFLGCPTRSLVT